MTEKLLVSIVFFLSYIQCQESKPFKEPKYQKFKEDDESDNFLPSMYYNFYEEKRSLVFDNKEEIISNKGPIVKTLYSSLLNLLKTEDDK